MELMLCILSAIFACAVFVVNWLYNKPKDEQTKALRDTVVELKEVVETLRDYAVANKVEIAKIDESAKSSHKITNLQQFIGEISGNPLKISIINSSLNNVEVAGEIKFLTIK